MASHKDEAEQRSSFLGATASAPRYSVEDEPWLSDEIEMSGAASDSLNHTWVDIAEEQQLVRRLDKRLLAFAMMGNLVKTLDNTNLSNAFISGMEEELDIQGTQYNWMTVLFMVGYLSMQIPSNLFLSRFRPSVYMPFLELIWCILTLSMAMVRSVTAVYYIRFLLGLAEAGFYPGMVFLVGSWYTKQELGKRNAWITICGALGGGLSGIIQAILLKTVDGVLGISGWRWMFLFDGTLTAFVAFFGFKYLPDYPSTTVWLNEKERSLAIRRLDAEGREERHGIRNFRKSMATIIRNPIAYLLVLGWTCLHLGVGAAHVLGIVAKKSGYDSVTANLFTSPDMIITMFANLANGFISDRYRSRQWCIVGPACVGLLGCSLLAGFAQPFGLLYAGFILAHAGLGSTQAVVITWASEIMAQGNEARALVVAIMNTSSSLQWTWAPIILWPVTDAPRYAKGFGSSVLFVIIFITCMIVVGRLYRRVKRKNLDFPARPIAELEPDAHHEGESGVPLLRPSQEHDQEQLFIHTDDDVMDYRR
ncbi:major facilitator superfamily domain-containing protein [Syncephalastrum racemosum]|uniref:Major facilitator superfamily domain-containing protein n=1 Tax=Syncephalastrum racemosum TaxID=13706 RepID=A0A1X2HTW9_SYNRA|nr:major facilitator superfamily domain-containing protein [Syncephalastrum racemosum]